MHEYDTFSSETLLIIFKIIFKPLFDTITIGYPHQFDLVHCVRKRMVTNAVTMDEELEYQSLTHRNRRSRGGPDRNEAGQGVQSCIISPVGDEITSGGENTLCIWDSDTGELLVGLIEDLDITVGIHLHQEVWSLDASDKFAPVFDGISAHYSITSSTTGYRFDSTALACTQLRDTA